MDTPTLTLDGVSHDAAEPGGGRSPITAMPDRGLRRGLFIRDLDHCTASGGAGVPLRVVRLPVSLQDIERRLALDVTSGRGDDLRDTAGEGAGVEDIVTNNDREVRTVGHEATSWPRWL
jgi:hypothetical protein